VVRARRPGNLCGGDAEAVTEAGAAARASARAAVSQCFARACRGIQTTPSREDPATDRPGKKSADPSHGFSLLAAGLCA
jgi:hypothetical protein